MACGPEVGSACNGDVKLRDPATSTTMDSGVASPKPQGAAGKGSKEGKRVDKGNSSDAGREQDSGDNESCSLKNAKAEVCNGLDDDCDGAIDEDTEVKCFDGLYGCIKKDGAWVCTGVCKTGYRLCQQGELSKACTGERIPQDEHCDRIEEVALDENCNGRVNENCSCVNRVTQACFTGPANTAGIGTCKAGTMACDIDQLGPCVEDITPSGIELCDSADNDCDGKTDETVDGKPYAIRILTDTGNCGGCDIQCAMGQVCCKGKCAAKCGK